MVGASGSFKFVVLSHLSQKKAIHSIGLSKLFFPPCYSKCVQAYFLITLKILPTYVYKPNTCAQLVYILLLHTDNNI